MPVVGAGRELGSLERVVADESDSVIGIQPGSQPERQNRLRLEKGVLGSDVKLVTVVQLEAFEHGRLETGATLLGRLAKAIED